MTTGKVGVLASSGKRLSTTRARRGKSASSAAASARLRVPRALTAGQMRRVVTEVGRGQHRSGSVVLPVAVTLVVSAGWSVRGWDRGCRRHPLVEESECATAMVGEGVGDRAQCARRLGAIDKTGSDQLAQGAREHAVRDALD